MYQQLDNMKNKIPRFSTAENRIKKPNPEKSHEGELLVVPDKALSVKKLLQMHINGTLPPVSREGMYEMDDFGEEIPDHRAQRLDFTDLDHMEEKVKTINEKYKKKQDEAKAEAEKKREEEIIAKHEAKKSLEKKKSSVSEISSEEKKKSN